MTGGTLWVEASAGDEATRRAPGAAGDGVSLDPDHRRTTSPPPGRSDDSGRPLFATVPGGERQREMAFRSGVNIVMYALTGNYKADQVHVPALLERLGQ